MFDEIGLSSRGLTAENLGKYLLSEDLKLIARQTTQLFAKNGLYPILGISEFISPNSDSFDITIIKDDEVKTVRALDDSSVDDQLKDIDDKLRLVAKPPFAAHCPNADTLVLYVMDDDEASESKEISRSKAYTGDPITISFISVLTALGEVLAPADVLKTKVFRNSCLHNKYLK